MDPLWEIQLPLIRTKKSHRKSRLGCLRCKERRVKCNERHPTCTACEQRSTICVWPKTHRKDSQPVTTEPCAKPAESEQHESSPPSTADSSPHLVLSVDELEVGETELAQCYLTRVSRSFGSDGDRPERDWVWQVHIPSLALSFPTVRDGMYTLAAIYLHFFEDQCTTRYIDAANFYGTRFVTTSRKQLARVDPSESDANMVCAKLLFVLGLAFHREYRSTSFQYSNPMMWTWAHMLSGIKTIQYSILNSGQAINPTMFLDMTHHLRPRSDRKSCVISTRSPAFEQLMAYIKDTQQERTAALRQLVLSGAVVLSEQKQTYLDAVETLHKVVDEIQVVDREDTIRAVCAAVTHMGPKFVHLLEQQDHVALAIYSHWLLMLMLTEDLWVVDDMGSFAMTVIPNLFKKLAYVITLRFSGRAGIEAILHTVHDPEMEYTLSFPRKALSFASIV